MKGAVLGARVFDAHEQKVVSFFCLFRDSLPGRSIMLANRDVDRRALVLAALRKLGVLGGRLDGVLDAIARFLVLLLAVLAGLALARQRQDRDRNAAGPGQEPCETRRELAVWTLVHREQQTFEIRNEARASNSSRSSRCFSALPIRTPPQAPPH